MNLTAYMTGGLALCVAVLYGLWTYDSHVKTARLEAATAMLDVARTNLTLATQTNDANVEAVNKIKAELARQQALTAKSDALAHDRAVELWKAKQRISNAPKTDDAPTAPVLRDELRALVRPSDPAADSHHEDTNGAAADPGKPDVPAAATPAGS